MAAFQRFIALHFSDSQKSQHKLGTSMFVP
jgi:hypothetical protein